MCPTFVLKNLLISCARESFVPKRILESSLKLFICYVCLSCQAKQHSCHLPPHSPFQVPPSNCRLPATTFHLTLAPWLLNISYLFSRNVFTFKFMTRQINVFFVLIRNKACYVCYEISYYGTLKLLYII